MKNETRALLEKRDPIYLKQLFMEINPYLMRVCLANSIREENAEDIIHQCWELFFSKPENFQGRSQIRTYICGILFNKVREYRRRVNKTILEEDSEKIFSQAFDAEGWWVHEPQSPQKILELKQSSHHIEECLEGLSEQQKTAFFMKEVEEEDSENICSILDITISHLRVLLFRAKDKLRLCLEGKE